ncbi:histone-lysine N-methyltransferase 2A isoform X2 [Latimeria chalumnae]|uniref:histone-lysine N-methyltransferase 2A isoform X2 n=1 Tax=Latimeria chalumnae TaxID=7897 RepID=UPI00313CD5A6
MAHICRWRFPARPGTGRKLGARNRVPALLPAPPGEESGGGDGSGSAGSGPAALGTAAAAAAPGPLVRVCPGFDAALQVSAAIGTNLRKFVDVFGETNGGSSSEDDQFLGFGSDDEIKRVRSPPRPLAVRSHQRKSRGRPRASSAQKANVPPDSSSEPSPPSQPEAKIVEKEKKSEAKSGEKRRGRPPLHGSLKLQAPQEKETVDAQKEKEERQKVKKVKKTPPVTLQHGTKVNKQRGVKMSPLKSKLKAAKVQINRKGVQVVRRRGRPPSSERLKVAPTLSVSSQLEKPQRIRKEKDGDSLQARESKSRVRQSPRRMKPVRIVPPSKRTDTTIAKQLLQRARKGAQKKMEKEAAKLQGRKGRTQLKNIRQFIMPVVSAISSRIIKTPKRFIEDDNYVPPIKISRLESTPNSRFSTTSCGSSEKSSAVSQHSSQMSSDSSRSSSPSVDTSSDSQASEEMQALSEEASHTSEVHPSSLAIAQCPETDGSNRRGRRYSVSERGLGTRTTKKLASSQSASQQPASSPSPPLLTPPQPLQPASAIPEHTHWLMPPTIPLPSPFLPASAAPMQEKRRSILREPTFKWASLKDSRSGAPCFSSAKYAKEGLIRKPIFDNFRPPPLTPEDVGLAPSGCSAAATHFFPTLQPGRGFEMHKRTPLLRAPQFTPSEAHSKIYESLTTCMASSTMSRTASGPGSVTGLSARKRKRRMSSPIRSEPRSPSHSMRTRSGRLSSSDLPLLSPQPPLSSSSVSGSSLTPSALTPAFPFPSSSVPQSEVLSEKFKRRPSNISEEPFPPSLFPLFQPSPQTDRGRNKEQAAEEVCREKNFEKGSEKEKGREKDREKENKRDSRKEKEKRGKGAELQSSASLSRISKEKDGTDDIVASSSSKKGRKKSLSADSVADGSPLTLVDAAVAKSKTSKKGRGGLEKIILDGGSGAASVEKEKTVHHPGAPTLSSSVVHHSTPSISSVLAKADKLPMADRRVASLLKKAKAQLCKIEKTKLKLTDQPKAQGQESDSSETSVRGPRIKHVCRRAAVALGRERARFPDDMPTLSALPWEDREKILSSMGNDDKSSIAGSEDAEPPAPPIKPIRPVSRHKAPQDPPVKKGRRSRRCGQCPGCQVPEDCGVCTNCLDKPKFGGRNIKKQCCKMRKCQNLQWMPSKAYLQKQAKVAKKKEKKPKANEKKEAQSGRSHLDSGQRSSSQSTAVKEDHSQKKNEPSRKPVEEVNEDTSVSVSTSDVKQVPALTPTRKASKQNPQQSQVNITRHPSPGPLKKEPARSTPSETKKKQLPQSDAGAEQIKQKKAAPRVSYVKPKPKEKEKPSPISKPEISTLNLLCTPCNGSSSKQKPPADGVHRIRVDFKEDCDLENVWEMGGLSILTSVPITPRVVCFLCASSGHTEFVYCQICCEPFHMFCLEESERPLEDQLENWCCRRCKFCHVCGRQHQATKQLLECNKCRNSYHPECLGPNYPTKPTKKKKVWICTKCVRCKSCGATTPGKGWDAQWSHDFSLCHDCAKLFAKGNFCPLCDKCYDDDDYESKMMQCGKCDRWVHAKCENLTDEMYEILSSLPESVAYTCINCTEQHPAEWRLALEKELQTLLRQVLTALLNSRTTSHLLRYRQAAKPPDLNPETEESIPSRSSPEGPDPPVLTEVSKQEDQRPLDLEGVKRKMDQGGYTSVLEFSDDIVKIIQAAMNSDGGQPENKKANSMVKSFFTRQMERVFPWFSVKESRFWEPNKVTLNNGMLPNAVLPPSLDHNYAQWQEREENSRAEQPLLLKKIIPAPRAKGPGDPDSPVPPPPPPPVMPGSDRSREDSPELIPPPDVEDNRQCVLCLKYGDDNSNESGRLLYIGQNEWTHVNCALWSAEVFEDDDGSLKNVHMAVIRGKQLRCEYCQKPGATVGCCLTSCTSNYHFMCARTKSCVFLDDKKVYCQRHRELVKGEVVPENGFEVLRRIFVDFEGISLRRKFLSGLESENIHMMIGSMTIDCLGILNDLSDCEDKLFPIGYQCSRVYWSTTDARKRCVYTCKIVECRPPTAEPDINSTVEHDDNRTIAHSPPLLTELTENQSTTEIPIHSPDHQHSQNLSPLLPSRPQGINRIKTPSYSPTQRSPGSRPLPSAGNPSAVTPEIVTVGDPLLSSGLRSIGSRRHSTSSLSPQQSKSWMPSTRAGGSYLRSNSSALTSLTGSPLDREVSNKTHEPVSGPLSSSTQSTSSQSNSSTSSRQRTGSLEGTSSTVPERSQVFDSRSSQSLSYLTSSKDHCVSSNVQLRCSSSKGEKSKSANTKESSLCTSVQPSVFVGGSNVSSQVHSTSNKGQFENSKSVLASDRKELATSSSMLTNQRGVKKSKEQNLNSSQTEKALKELSQVQDPDRKNVTSSESGSIALAASEHPVSNSKEKRNKIKKSAKELVKESHSDIVSTSDSPGSTKTNLSVTKQVDNQNFAPENLNLKSVGVVSGTEKTLSEPSENQAVKSLSVQTDSSTKEQHPAGKRTVKVTLMPLRMDFDKPKKDLSSSKDQAGKNESVIPTLISEQSENDSVAQLNPTDADKPGPQGADAHQNLSEQDGNLALQDGNKPQEHGSIKRRYPRRSARARSNMFFGLTPLYGVRSYGEEDIPFFSNSTGKKRGKRSAEGQVDGADDISTSSDEEEDYYYNFTRTVIASGAEDRLGSRGLFRGDERDLPRISQLDGVDDGTESDASVTPTAGKVAQMSKRGSKENGSENLELDRSEESEEKDQVTKSSSGHKSSDSKIENCLPVARVKPQGQDSLEAQLSSLDTTRRNNASTSSEKNLLDSFNTELLKADSDNNNSDDCGNILPSDIMDFVLNTPSMQNLGESPESSSSELLTLGEGLGLDSNRGKDMGLFEVFSQQLPNSEPVESSVSSTMSAEEQFELPLELPSDLSVLTTRSPSVPSQNHGSLTVISESQITSSGDRPMLSISSTEGTEKGVTVTEKPAPSGEGEASLLAQPGEPAAEGHMTPDQFIQEHIGSPSCTVEQGTGSNQDLHRSSGTPGLQVPVSPTVSLQSQKYVPNTVESPGPSQITNTAVQTTPPHLKPGTEKLIVVNQHMQPLYVFQTLPNGVTQKIQFTPSVGPASAVMETSTSALGTMGSGLTLAAGINPNLTASQSIFSPASKGIMPLPHHPQLHPFTAASQASFQPSITSSASGLLIGVQPSTDPQPLVSDSSQRADLSSTSAATSGHSKKRQISRLHSRRKKLAPSGSQPTIAPSEILPNMALINFSPSQLPGGVSAKSGLVDLRAVANTAPQRTVPNIIKRSKSGVMYFEQAPLLPQTMGGTAVSSVVGTSQSVIGQDGGHLATGSVHTLASSQPVLNVPMQAATTTAAAAGGGSASGHILGQSSVTLTSPGLLGSPELAGSISNLLIKASQQSLGFSEHHMTLPSLTAAHSTSATAITTASGICVLPSSQTVGLPIAPTSSDHEGAYQLQQHITQLLASKAGIIPSQLDLASAPSGQLTANLSQLMDVGLSLSACMPQMSSAPTVPSALDQHSVGGSTATSAKSRPKTKRIQPAPEKGNGKKHKASHQCVDSMGARIPDSEVNARSSTSAAGSSTMKLEEPDGMEAARQLQKEGRHPARQGTGVAEIPPNQNTANTEEQNMLSESKSPTEDDEGFSSPLLDLLRQEQRKRECYTEKKPKKGLIFEISSDDGFRTRAETIEDAWKSLTDRVQEARSNARLKQLSFAGVNGLRMLGIIHDAVVFLIEQLYGAKHCRNYKFRFHKPEEADEPPINPHGSARAEIHQRKSSFDMFNFLASKHRQPPDYNPNDEEEEEVQLKSARRATSMDLPMPMRFRHLKKTSKEAVGVYRSPIHGRGLFCKRNIDAGEMVIEYSGNVIRSVLTDKREKYYDSKGIGCYMFRIDDYEVVDATMHGNAARFINHSCEPNCYSRVINIDSQKHIVIFAMRKIYRGEELTYDYKFPIEDASNKLPCNCGAKKCRKFLN